jgi:hypothetical protein
MLGAVSTLPHCGESNNLEQRILCSLDLRRRCLHAPELVIAVHIDSLFPACETKSLTTQCEEICPKVSSKVVAELNALEAINTLD